MKTEIQLQTQVVGTLYVLAAFVMLTLSIQTYRYGYYPLTYTASLLMLTFLVTAIYARFAYKVSNLERASLISLGIATFLLLKDSPDHAEIIKYWTYPLGLFGYIALPYRQSSLLNGMIIVGVSACLLLKQDLYAALAFASSFALLIALASTFAQLHKQRSRSLVELAIRDSVTDAYNVRHLEDTIKKEQCRSDQTGRPVSIVAIEIDYFSELTETHSKPEIDRLFKDVSELLKNTIRAGDSHYFDGEKNFFLMLPCTSAEGVLVISERIRRRIEENTWPEVDSITASLGCCAYNKGDQSISSGQLLRNTKSALNEAQRLGHNRVSQSN